MERPVFNFTEPKKKRKAIHFETGPFPIPIETLTGIRNSGQQWSCYQGQLIGNAVHISSLTDMEAVYQMGFFGKGNLSWSSPDYNIAMAKDRQPQKKAKEETFLRLLSRRRYMKHMEWQMSKKKSVESEIKTSRVEEVCGRTTTQTELESASEEVQSNDTTLLVHSPLSSDNHNLDEFFASDDDKSDGVLVVEDTEDEGEADFRSDVVPQKRLKEEIVARDPFPLKENLQLGLEEAFFLSYGLGCLVVTDNILGPMNLTQMWERFCNLSPKFLSRYIAYHNFRSKGWVVKTGIKYGVDFVLYRKGPPFYHSSYSVIVSAVDEGFQSEKESKFDWTSLCCVNRVTEQVSKELMFCYVIKPKDLSEEDLRSAKCISRFRVSEMIVRRWVSKKERENAEYLEMP